MKYIFFIILTLVSFKGISQFKKGQLIFSTKDSKKDSLIVQEAGNGWYSVLNKTGKIDTIYLKKSLGTTNNNEFIATPPAGYNAEMPVSKADSATKYHLKVVDTDKNKVSNR
ncbi:MAG: hypothetical protein WCP65_04570 [Bacteroidota bacterium]